MAKIWGSKPINRNPQDPDEKPCRACAGYGVLYRKDENGKRVYDLTCKVCNGTGKAN